eukprot:CAMPEP_0170624272 /NCGR_PEP_ID=MMETSP0224-20130122/30142_1 /TAXON_ID=285029 /ORGANISM="Togula jolla, Strain CCCM 725" /LENGTH=287 /DNA_ID=CAMNT_0010950779 /DNA_START=356 /DNA_END=1217 /DNA_ORIENTATION=-
MIDQDPTFRVLRADGASQGILIPTIPASWRVTPTKDAAVFAQARLPGLQLPPLLYASLPHVVTDVAEMGGAEAEVVRLALAAVAALPAQELGAMLRTLELPLRGASPAHEFHRKSGLHVFVQVLLFFLLHACTLHLAAMYGSLHCEHSKNVILDIARVAILSSSQGSFARGAGLLCSTTQRCRAFRRTFWYMLNCGVTKEFTEACCMTAWQRGHRMLLKVSRRPAVLPFRTRASAQWWCSTWPQARRIAGAMLMVSVQQIGHHSSASGSFACVGTVCVELAGGVGAG